MGTKPDVLALFLEPQRRIGSQITQHTNVNDRDWQRNPSPIFTKPPICLALLLSELHGRSAVVMPESKFVQ